MFRRDVAKGVTYGPLYSPRALDPFVVSPARFLAADGLHPSSGGYKLSFQMILAKLCVSRILSIEARQRE